MAILQECPTCRRKQSNKNKICRCGEDLDRAKRSKRVRYWINYEFKKKQYREAAGFSIEKARDSLSKRKVQIRENRFFDDIPDHRMTFDELTEWYLALDKVKALSSFWVIELSLKKFNKVFGDKIVSRVKLADLENYQARRRNQGAADGTIDHEIGKTKTMIFKAFDNDLVGSSTYKTWKRIKKVLKRGSDVRDRILTADEYQSLYHHSPLYLRGILAIAYFTGMRRGEILKLTWDKVNLKTRLINLEAKDTKDRESRKVPICKELYLELKNIPRAIHDDHVFLYKGKPIKDARRGLKAACQKVGIKYGRSIPGGFVFHDFRHTFNTNMRKAGVPESVIMEITGHSTREMFDRYNSVDDDDRYQAISRLERFLTEDGPIRAPHREKL
jgi:integrase